MSTLIGSFINFHAALWSFVNCNGARDFNILLKYGYVVLKLALALTLICISSGYSTNYTNGTYTGYLGYRFMQKVERLVALGNCTDILMLKNNMVVWFYRITILVVWNSLGLGLYTGCWGGPTHCSCAWVRNHKIGICLSLKFKHF